MVFDTDILRSLLQRQKVATLARLKESLGTSATMTVFRKLKALGYRTSYSHRGKYYTLAGIPRFDERGLWCCRAVWFSRDGNLLATTQSIGRLRGRFYSYRGSKVIVTYHPAYLLRTPTAKKDVWEDMKLLLREMGLPAPE